MQKECKILDAPYTLIVLYYTYIRIYTSYIFSIKLFCELEINSRANVLSHVLADLPLIIIYVQDVLEIRACVKMEMEILIVCANIYF